MRHKLATIGNMDTTLIDTLVYRIHRVSQALVTNLYCDTGSDAVSDNWYWKYASGNTSFK